MRETLANAFGLVAASLNKPDFEKAIKVIRDLDAEKFLALTSTLI